jgi:dihydropteroate synthase
VIVTPVSVRDPSAVRDALLSHGWEGDLASATAGGIESAGFMVSGIESLAIETMVPLAARLGLELVTGDDWLLLIGPRARLGAFARPWVQPEPVQELAAAIGMAIPPEEAPRWRNARGELSLDTAVMVGVINVTPDSFSPPNRVITADEALRLADSLLLGGAVILDVGGESTRPGAIPVGADHEQARVLPVIATLVEHHPELIISVDTVHASTARAAIDLGAAIINDVTAGRHDPAILAVAAETGASLVLSHSRGQLGTLADYSHADYRNDVTGAVVAELLRSANTARTAGVMPDALALDPGFGFGKLPEHNWTLLRQLDALVALGYPVLVGVSRKRFLGEATGRQLEDRDRATAAASAMARERGAHLFRVHDPAAVADALAVAELMAP